MSTAAIILVQIVAMLTVFKRNDFILEFIAVGGVCLVTLVWVILVLATPAEKCDIVILDEVGFFFHLKWMNMNKFAAIFLGRPI